MILGSSAESDTIIYAHTCLTLKSVLEVNLSCFLNEVINTKNENIQQAETRMP